MGGRYGLIGPANHKQMRTIIHLWQVRKIRKFKVRKMIFRIFEFEFSDLSDGNFRIGTELAQICHPKIKNTMSFEALSKNEFSDTSHELGTNLPQNWVP